jgi:3-oxoacyl-[acyl-carrier-protein] synthase-3
MENFALEGLSGEGEAVDEVTEDLNPIAQATLRNLLRVWLDFEMRLGKVPVLRRLDLGTFTRQDYMRLLLNLRQQVIEGSRWITRAASSFDRSHAELRSIVIGHAKDEHKDYEILEKDYVALGGNK